MRTIRGPSSGGTPTIRPLPAPVTHPNGYDESEPLAPMLPMRVRFARSPTVPAANFCRTSFHQTEFGASNRST